MTNTHLLKITKLLYAKKWLLLLFSLLILHSWWSYTGRNSIQTHTPLNIREISEVGEEIYSENIVCIQPYMLPQDYASLEVFYNKVDGYFTKVKEEGLLNENTIIVLPEHMGTPLALVNEKRSTINSSTFNEALFFAVTSNIWQIGLEKTKYSQYNIPTIFFNTKTEEMGKIFNFVFSSMARKYKVFVVPGTILLGEPNVENGVLESTKGAIQNISVLYDPNGKAHQRVISEHNLNDTETLIAKNNTVLSPAIFDTPLDKLAIILGDDTWDIKQNIEKFDYTRIIINPISLLFNLDTNSKTYFESLNKASQHKERITLASSFIDVLNENYSDRLEVAISVFMQGQFWGNTLYGKTMIRYQNQFITGFDIEGASIISLGIK